MGCYSFYVFASSEEFAKIGEAASAELSFEGDNQIFELNLVTGNQQNEQDEM